ncbi:MAG: hypothetical protein HQL75_07220 [Magnetococcales bacterium]|nr:hypothetical protein [Magnetococcales bacterium]
MRKEDILKLFKQGVIVDFHIICCRHGVFVKYFLNNGDDGILEGWDRRKGWRRFRSLDSAFNAVQSFGKDIVLVLRDENFRY